MGWVQDFKDWWNRRPGEIDTGHRELSTPTSSWMQRKVIETGTCPYYFLFYGPTGHRLTVERRTYMMHDDHSVMVQAKGFIFDSYDGMQDDERFIMAFSLVGNRCQVHERQNDLQIPSDFEVSDRDITLMSLGQVPDSCRYPRVSVEYG